MKENLSRRDFLRLAVATPWLVKQITRPAQAAAAAEAQPPAEIPNIEIGQEPANTWFHPMSAGNVWSYFATLQRGENTRLSLEGSQTTGNLFAFSSDTASEAKIELGIKVDPQYVEDYRQGQAYAASWLATGPNDIVELYDKDGNLITRTRASNPATNGPNQPMSASAGILLPPRESEYHLIIKNDDGNPINVQFGHLSREDWQRFSGTRSLDDTVIHPDFPLPPLSRFQDAAPGQRFRADTGSLAWNPAITFKLPDTQRANINFLSTPNLGEFVVEDKGNRFEFYMHTLPGYMDAYRDSPESLPGMWINRLEGPEVFNIDLLDRKGERIATLGSDDKGFAGILLPTEFPTLFGARVRVRQGHPLEPETTRSFNIKFGPGTPENSLNQPQIIDARDLFPQVNLNMPLINNQS